MRSKKTAVVLLNLGGPDSLESVQPFLFNLFYDRRILNLPNPWRWMLAKIISRQRAPIAKSIYDKIGGSSPINQQTEDQRRALEAKLNEERLKEAGLQDSSRTEYRVFNAMRYWHPLTEFAAEQVKKFNPDQVVLLPLYPQFSSTTSLSSIEEWKRRWENKSYKERGDNTNITQKPVVTQVAIQAICCYPQMSGWVKAYQDLIRKTIKEAHTSGAPLRILFSAHSLPMKIVNQGDPYPSQVQAGVEKIMAGLGDLTFEKVVVCYQSKVGPVKWLGPQTDDEIKQAAQDKVGIIIVPVAFVSEHSETLVELDIEYKSLAKEEGAPYYLRVPAVQTHPDFIQGLCDLVKQVDSTNEASNLNSPAKSGINYCQSNWRCKNLALCPTEREARIHCH